MGFDIIRLRAAANAGTITRDQLRVLAELSLDQVPDHTKLSSAQQAALQGAAAVAWTGTRDGWFGEAVCEAAQVARQVLDGFEAAPAPAGSYESFGVTVVPLDREAMRQHPSQIQIRTGHSADALLSAITNARADAADQVYLLTWTGGRVPRPVIGVHQIGWTQHGQVISSESVELGVYERLVDCGGPKRDQQQMLVFLDRDALMRR